MTLEPPANTYDSVKLPFRQHAMLRYSNNGGGDSHGLAIRYVNEALSREHLTIYISANTDNIVNISGIPERNTSKIINYEDKVNRGDLLTLNYESFYKYALDGNMQPLEELKVITEEAINERTASGKSNEVTIVNGISGSLAANQEFDPSINVEKWTENTHSEWLKKGLQVTIICLHPRSMLDKNELMHYKQAMSSLHTTTLL
jgi:hypothetical protein